MNLALVWPLIVGGLLTVIAIGQVVSSRARLREAESRLRDAEARTRASDAVEAQMRAISRDMAQSQAQVDEMRAAKAALEEEMKRKQMLLEMGASVLDTLELQSLLHALLKKLRELFDFHAAGVFLYNQDETELLLMEAEGLHQNEMARQLRTDISLPAIAASSEKPILVSDTSTDPRFSTLRETARVHSALYHPIASNKNVYGVICLWSYDAGAYSQKDLALLASITTEAARAIRNAETHQQLNARLTFIVTLWEASKNLNTSSVESDAKAWRKRLGEVVNSAAFLFGAQKVVLFRYDKGRRDLGVDLSVGVDEKRLPMLADALNGGHVGLPVLLRAPFQVKRLLKDARFSELAGFASGEDVYSLLWAPLNGRQRTVGALALFTQSPRVWTEMELQWLDIFTNMLSVSLENTSLFQDLASEKSQLQVLVDNVPEGVFTTDSQGRVVTWNAAAQRITGWGLSEVVGRRCADLIRCHTVEKAWCDDACPLRIAIDKSVRFDSGVQNVSIQTAEGGTVPVFITSGPIFTDEGAVSGAILVFRDITKEKEIEQMKEDFLAIITHDLKSPLASVMGYAELLLNPKLGSMNNNQNEFVQSILRSSKTLQFLIDNILELTRMEAGKMQFNPRPFNFGGFLAEIHEMFAPLAAPKSLLLEARCDDGVIVRGDRDKLKEVFINLYANAIKFTKPGGRIRTAVEVDGDRVRIHVSDTGKGIPADQISGLFERFAQIKSDERRGTGLGLYIVRRIMQAHGETIDVQSELGVGTTFSFGLPRVRTHGAANAEHGVLVLERDEETADALRRMLEEQGIPTDLANSARDALRFIGQRKPRVLIIDSQMPELAADNLLDELKAASEREGQTLRIMLLCDWREESAVKADMRIYRPLDETEVLRKVRALIPPLET